MFKHRGFTLIELMVVVMIIAILAAIAVPMMQGRIESSKWSEANSAAGTIATAIRTYVGEKGPTYSGYSADLVGGVAVFGPKIGIASDDLEGTYFGSAAYAITSITVPGATGSVDFVITVTPANGLSGTTASGAARTLNQNGVWQ